MAVFTKKRVWTVVALVALAGIAWAGFALQAKMEKQAEKPQYRWAEADRGTITQYITASGRLEPVSAVNIGTQVSGTVVERLADFNDKVKAGQVLLKLDPTIFNAQIKQARASLDSANATLALARSNFERNSRLVAQGFISPAVLEQSKKEMDAGTASVQLSKAQLDRAQADLNNSIIRSPIDGVVIKRSTDIGQTVAASFQTPDLYQVAKDLREMQISTSVSEADVGLLKSGQTVKFTVDAYPDREFTGAVRQFRLSPNVQQNVVTYNIMIDVDNKEELLKPGMTAQTRILVANKENVVRIPTAALRYRPSDIELMMKKLKGEKDEKKDEKKDGKKEDAKDIGREVLSDEEDKITKGGLKVYKVYKLGEKNQTTPVDVTIGVSNNRVTEMVSGDVKPGDKLVTRSLLAEAAKNQ